MIVAGAVLAQAGLIVMTPAVVGAVGRLGRLLPVAPRLLVPWTTLGVTMLAVPLLAMLAALALTRSRIPLERRLA